VPAAASVYDCVELEVDLVEPRGEDHIKGYAIGVPFPTGEESRRQPEVEERSGSGIQPAFAEAEVIRYELDGC
jgi:hypothetical protein